MKAVCASLLVCAIWASAMAEPGFPEYPRDRNDDMQALSNLVNLCIASAAAHSPDPLAGLLDSGAVPDATAEVSLYYRTEDGRFWVSYLHNTHPGDVNNTTCRVEVSAAIVRTASLKLHDWFVNYSEEMVIAGTDAFIGFGPEFPGYYSLFWPLCNDDSDYITLSWRSRSRASWFHVAVNNPGKTNDQICDELEIR